MNPSMNFIKFQILGLFKLVQKKADRVCKILEVVMILVLAAEFMDKATCLANTDDLSSFLHTTTYFIYHVSYLVSPRSSEITVQINR